jgi:hypothetical protein
MHRTQSIAPAIAFLAAALTMNGCSSGGSSGGGDGGDGGPDVNLQFHGLHYHQDFYGSPNFIAFWWSVRNDSDQDVGPVQWRLTRVDGPSNESKSGSMGVIPAHAQVGDGHEFHVDWLETQLDARHTWLLTIDPNNRITESDKNDNSYTFIVDTPSATMPSQAGDIEFRTNTPHFHAVVGSPNAYVFHFEATNTGASTLEGVDWRLRCADIGYDETFTLDAMPAGGTVEASTPVEVPEGQHEFTLTLDSGDDVDETNEANNSRVFVVLVAAGGSG